MVWDRLCLSGSRKRLPVYIYAFQDDEQSTKLLQFLTGDPLPKIEPIDASETIMTVSGDFPEICGPMSGLRVPVTLRAPGSVCDSVEMRAETFRSVIRAIDGEVLFGVICAGVPFFLNVCDRTLDIDALSPEYFDVKTSFCEAVPLVTYVKWAFRDAAGSRDETNACLIVDDPPLGREIQISGLPRSAGFDGTAQLHHDSRLHSVELAPDRSAHIAHVPEPSRATFSGGSRLRPHGRRIRRALPGTIEPEDPEPHGKGWNCSSEDPQPIRADGDVMDFFRKDNSPLKAGEP